MVHKDQRGCCNIGGIIRNAGEMTPDRWRQISLLMIVADSSLDYRVPHGLQVRVVRPDMQLIRSLGIQPLRIRVEADGLLVDSKLIEVTGFDAFLRTELLRRPPDWQVYAEADRDLEFETVAKTVDVIRAAHAEVVLLTPGYKAALGESGPQRETPTYRTIAK